MSLSRTSNGKVVLYHASTGERFERWPVDAREMLATGAYTTDTPDAAPDAAAVSVAESGEQIAGPADLPTAGGAMSPTGAPLVVGKAVGVAAPVSLPTSSAARQRR